MTVRLKIESRGENSFSGDLCYHRFDQWDANKYAGVGSKRFSVLNNRSPSAKHSKYKEREPWRPEGGQPYSCLD